MLARLTSCGAPAIFAMLLAATAAAQTHTYTFTPQPNDPIQTFAVPTGATMLRIIAEGGSGGRQSGQNTGGGGRIQGDVRLPAGAVIKMMIARRGANNSGTQGSGGGGGTYLTVGQNGLMAFATPLLVAGGGSGLTVSGSGQGFNHGGMSLGGSGNGGVANSNSGSGGGILSHGSGQLQAGGRSAISGGAGGQGGTSWVDGGFGGGGAGITYMAGGGGGYSGGRAGNAATKPLGGTSFAAPEVCNVVNTPGANAFGGGSVRIVVHYAPPTTYTFDHTGSLQTFVVPAGAALMTIQADGASGGGSNAIIGGLGGRITGDIGLAPGTTLQLLIGSKGQGGGPNFGGAGGGGTFVAVGTSGNPDFANPLLVAGGGGGRNRVAPAAGGHGGELLGGSGQGGVHASSAGSGAGILSDGSNGVVAFGGTAPIHGGAGGTGDRDGGYGGGGGSANLRAGGGGGYTGGIAGTSTNTSTGGTSFADASVCSVVNEPGVINNSNGRVTITVYLTAQVEPIGQGCSGDTLTAESLPWINETFSAKGTNLPNTALVCAVTGFAETTLPLVVAFPQAGPTCNLLVTADLVDVLVTTNGTATSSLPLPNDTTLVGLQFYQQMVSLEVDALLTVTDVTATNALRATIGF